MDVQYEKLAAACRIPTKGTTTISPDGYWMVTNWSSPKTSWAAAASGTTKLTYDPSTSRWVQIGTGSQGGYSFDTSPGWQGKKIVWTPLTYMKSNATEMVNPTTSVKMSATKTVDTNTFTEPGGRVVSVKAICTKG